MDLELIFWTLLLLLLLLWLVRKVHEGLQELFYLLTEHKTIAVYLFQIILLPGVILHEFSHLLVAKLLGIRVRKVSLHPEVRGNKIQMGAIVLDRPDFIRGLFIGLAPLVLGSLAIVLIGQHVFEVSTVIEAANTESNYNLLDVLRAAFQVNDAWIWLYLIFAVSNAMLPSASDRASVWPMLAFTGLIVLLAAVAGWGQVLLANLAEPVESALGLLVVAFSITLFVDVMFIALIMVLKVSVSFLTGRTLE
jgi:hypothetical protein